MSMHEIEDLVEATIRIIDILDISSHEKRQLIANFIVYRLILIPVIPTFG